MPYRDPHRVSRKPGTVVLTTVSDGSRTLRLKEPLSIPLVKDSSTNLLVAEYEPLKIHAYGATKQAVAEQIGDELFVMWDEYVVGEPQRLSDDAQGMRATVLEHMEEITGSADQAGL